MRYPSAAVDIARCVHVCLWPGYSITVSSVGNFSWWRRCYISLQKQNNIFVRRLGLICDCDGAVCPMTLNQLPRCSYTALEIHASLEYLRDCIIKSSTCYPAKCIFICKSKRGIRIHNHACAHTPADF